MAAHSNDELLKMLLSNRFQIALQIATFRQFREAGCVAINKNVKNVLGVHILNKKYETIGKQFDTILRQMKADGRFYKLVNVKK